MSDWISVEEELPENDIRVIACGKRREQFVDGLGDFNQDFVGEVIHFDDGCFVHGINAEIMATHWMPLPKPPQKPE